MVKQRGQTGPPPAENGHANNDAENLAVFNAKDISQDVRICFSLSSYFVGTCVCGRRWEAKKKGQSVSMSLLTPSSHLALVL
jgi:hypothetical protein